VWIAECKQFEIYIYCILVAHFKICFQILVGPSDWEDYSKGKEGSTRYRIHNLPQDSGPGVYELGVAITTSGLGREIFKLTSDPHRVVVVYLGKADNVRTRLQCYGRNGAHLGNSCSSFESSGQMGRSLFHEIFFQGFPIVYRWAPVSTFYAFIIFIIFNLLR
jgi:hypothetical protein